MPKLNLKKILLTIESAIAVFLLFNCVASAQSVTQGYKSDTLLQNGMIVGLDPKDVTKVEPINSDQYNLLHGVVVNPSNSIILISNFLIAKCKGVNPFLSLIVFIIFEFCCNF